MRKLTFLSLVAVFAMASVVWAGPAVKTGKPIDSPPYALLVGKIITITKGNIDHGVILVKGGKIQTIGSARKIKIPSGYKVFDYRDKFAMPGLIDCHAHIVSRSFRDLNDMVHPINPELNNLSTIVPNNQHFRNALQGGVTTLNLIPGSGTNMSGFGTILKTHGDSVDEALVRFPGSLKIAQALNPERRSGDMGRTRMGMNWMIRGILRQAQKYHSQWEAYEKDQNRPRPEKIKRLENFRLIFEDKIPVIVHTAAMQPTHATVRILRDEFGLDPIISHATFDGYLNAKGVVRRNMHIDAGPRQFHYDRKTKRIYGVAARWHQGGVKRMSINTDSPVVPQEMLFYQAAMAVRFGLPEEKALEALTMGPAKALRIAHRVGSLEKGKDGDIVILDGPPLDVRSRVIMVLVNGRIAYSLKRDKGRF